MTDTAFINRTLGAIYTDLGYLVDVGILSEDDYNLITSKIPRRHTGALPAITAAASAQPQNHIQPDRNDRRQVPSAPSHAPTPVQPAPTPQPPKLLGIAQCDALYDYSTEDAGDLPFRKGDKLLVLEYCNADWWRGQHVPGPATGYGKPVPKGMGRVGLFPSNYVQKTAVTGVPDPQVPLPQTIPYQQAVALPSLAPEQYNPQRYDAVSYAQGGPQQVTVVQDKKTGQMHKVGGKLGNAVIFGAGATIGSSIVNAIL
ncbi:SH3 domain-containing protein [Protomyces lactucae-debilis]|uniref:SH3 domain-containing protein n=1 Tax=Protomyces lactucae-debilis TaxID=2754530 RepID=A0A1Y2FIP0_PROLT|nr:SH3 domain-containing protein [Protomyces lactucae-debilis]ORY83808.1 SH3 domain-containing protein [Protomyces lactucae-debilis]